MPCTICDIPKTEHDDVGHTYESQYDEVVDAIHEMTDVLKEMLNQQREQTNFLRRLHEHVVVKRQLDSGRYGRSGG